MQSFFYFLLLLGGLIFFHEFGHFIVARLVGVRVETFSIGFGPALLKWRRGHTLYKLALVPLGGFVKMFGDEVDSKVPEADRAEAFNYKPLWQRSLVVIAGPFFNLILPFFVFFALFLGYTDLTPSYVGALVEAGPAFKGGLRAGDTVTSVDGKPVSTWWELETVVNRSAGRELLLGVRRAGGELALKVTPEAEARVRVKELGLTETVGRIQILPVYLRPVVTVEPGSAAEKAGLRTWDLVLSVDGKPVKTWAELSRLLSASVPRKLSVVRPTPLGQAGPAEWALLEPAGELSVPGGPECGVRSSEFVIHRVDPGTPAAAIGLLKGDEIISLDGTRYPLWSLLIYTFADSPEKEHKLVVRRAGVDTEYTFKLAETEEKGEFNEDRKTVVFGAYNYGAYGVPEVVPNPAVLSYAATQTWEKTLDAYEITLLSLAGLFRGQVKMKDMGGPIMIYDMASKTAQHGWEYFFRIMVWLSVSLGIINLFPIPILDGGHLFFFGIEAVIRRPVSPRIRQIAAYVGLALVLVLMVFVFANDIQRSWGSVGGLF